MSELPLAEQSAFPGVESSFAAMNSRNIAYTGLSTYGGMTYRQWLAGLAMQALLSNSEFITAAMRAGLDNSAVAKTSVANADAIIAELEKSSS